jgi:hypothetical protein
MALQKKLFSNPRAAKAKVKAKPHAPGPAVLMHPSRRTQAHNEAELRPQRRRLFPPCPAAADKPTDHSPLMAGFMLASLRQVMGV